LALACFACNNHKGPNIAGVDQNTGDVIRLFHPRRDNWEEHFEWRGASLVGRTNRAGDRRRSRDQPATSNSTSGDAHGGGCFSGASGQRLRRLGRSSRRLTQGSTQVRHKLICARPRGAVVILGELFQ
jgi:hypothetical protein